MEGGEFQAWLAEADGLSARQREEAARVLAEPASLASVLALLEARIGETRCCAHCATEGAVIRGRSNGLKRYRCGGCGRTFNALTGTPLARLRKKELWAAFAAGLSDGDTVKGAAGRCGVADTTAFRWRHRFLAAVTSGAVKLKGIVEADDLCPDQPQGGAQTGPQGAQTGRAGQEARPLQGASPDPRRHRPERHHAHPRSAGSLRCRHRGSTRGQDRARRHAGHRRRQRLCALRPILGHHPRAFEPQRRRAAARRASSQHGQQPARAAQILPAQPAWRRHQISRQLSGVVPPRHPAQAANTALRPDLGRRSDTDWTASRHSKR